MQQRSDYFVLAMIVLSSMITTALGAHVAGFELPPALVFGLLVCGAPIPTMIAVLPQLGVRVPRLPSEYEAPVAAKAAGTGTPLVES